MPNAYILNIYCDGGARGNPGPAACAFVVVDPRGQTLYEQGQYLGITTNNQAEYQGVLIALHWLVHNYPGLPQAQFHLDSQLVVNQLNGLWKTKDITLQQKVIEVHKLLGRLDQLKIRNFKYIPRSLNYRADLLVNQTLNTSSSK